MMIKQTLTILIIAVTILIAEDDGKNAGKQSRVTRELYRIDVNRLDLPMHNDGSTGDRGAAWYPNGQESMSWLYYGGFALTGWIEGTIHTSWMAETSGIREYQPGWWGGNPESALARWYPISSDDTSGSQAFTEWTDAVAMGARFEDLDGDGIYDPFTDRPPLLGRESVWTLMNDDVPPDLRSLGTEPLGVEIHQTVSAFSNDGPLNDAVIFQLDIINRTENDIDSLIFGIWQDTDLGEAHDDLLGSDSLLEMGYMYNFQSDPDYGAAPPAFGIVFLQGGVYDSPDNAAQVYIAPHLPLETIEDAAIRDLTSVSYYSASLGDPRNGLDAWLMQLGGFHADGNNEPISPTLFGTGGQPDDDPRFMWSGDPVAGTGWRDNTPADKRIVANSGQFQLPAGETRHIVFAYVGGRGESALGSVTKMKENVQFLRSLFPHGKAVRIAAGDTIQPYDSEFVFNAELFEFLREVDITSADWSIINRPAGSVVDIQPQAGFTASLFPDLPGEYRIQLSVLLDNNRGLTDHLTIHAVNAHVPNAEITIEDNDLRIHDMTILDGSATSDPDGNALSYNWQIPSWLAADSIDLTTRIVTATKMGNGVVTLIASNDYFSDSASVEVSSRAISYRLEETGYLPGPDRVGSLQRVNNTIFAYQKENEPSLFNQVLYRFSADDLTGLRTDTLNGTHFHSDGDWVIAYGLDFDVSIYQIIDDNILLAGSIPVSVAESDWGFNVGDVHLNYPWLYIPVQNPRQLQVYDISDPQDPLLVSYYPLNDHFYDLIFRDDQIAALVGVQLHLINISKPEKVFLVHSSYIGSIWAADAELLTDTYLILRRTPWSGFELKIIDVSDLSNPMVINTLNYEDVPFSSHFVSAALSGNRLMVGQETEASLLDISDPLSPAFLANRYSGYKSKGMLWIDDQILISDHASIENGGGIYRLRYDSTLVHIEDSAEIPRKFALEQNYPNPFNGQTVMGYSLSVNSWVQLDVYNIAGQRVKTAINDQRSAGRHEFMWDGTNDFGRPVASGVYFYRLTAINQQPTTNNRFSMARKMILLR